MKGDRRQKTGDRRRARPSGPASRRNENVQRAGTDRWVVRHLFSGILFWFLTTTCVFAQETPHLKIPSVGAYTGAYMDWGDTEDDVHYEKITAFEKLAGKHQAIVAFSSYWGKKSFPREAVDDVLRYGAVPLIYWSPWGPPYEQNEPQPDYSLEAVLEGRFDDYIRMWAREAATVHAPILVSWGLEMNGNWFPWSGPCQGAQKKTYGDPRKEDGPEKYVQAFRYVVGLVRGEKALNVEWVFHANNYSFPDAPWNSMKHYYPGDDVVDWLAMSVYGQQFPESDWKKFDDVISGPYLELAALSSKKPIMLAEWGVGEFPRNGSKAEFLDQAFASMTSKYPRLKGAVYWHERWQNPDERYSNLRINSSPRTLTAYRRGVNDPFWIAFPRWESPTAVKR